MAQELHLHLLELARPERKLPGVISLRKLLPICATPNGGFTRIDEMTFLKLTKMPCAVSGAGTRARVLRHGADVRLEHQVELPGLGQIALGELARMLRRPPAAFASLELVGAEAELAGTAVDERVGEPETCPEATQTCGLRMIAESSATTSSRSWISERAPSFFTLSIQQHAVVAEVERRAEPAVDVRRREDERAASAQRGDLLDGRRTLELLELHVAESTYSSVSPSQ